MEVNLSERVPVNRPVVSQAVLDQPEGAYCTLQDYSLYISVIDTGIGIAAADQAQLFQPFIQLDSRLNRQYEGTGLGLTLVKQIVELHGGSVTLQSEPGQGSCFTICIPYRCVPCPQVSWVSGEHHPTPTDALLDPVMHPATNPVPSPIKIVTAPLILLVEDNQASISTLSSYLTAKHYQILLARNGQEAIALAKIHHPDLILMDIQMPGIDGLEATRQIRLDPALADTPIIALTALVMEGDRDRCIAAGVNDYLIKPVKLKQLVITIQKFLTKELEIT